MKILSVILMLSFYSCKQSQEDLSNIPYITPESEQTEIQEETSVTQEIMPDGIAMDNLGSYISSNRTFNDAGIIKCYHYAIDLGLNDDNEVVLIKKENWKANSDCNSLTVRTIERAWISEDGDFFQVFGASDDSLSTVFNDNFYITINAGHSGFSHSINGYLFRKL